MRDKNAQVAIWFILGAILVGSILLLFMFDLTPDNWPIKDRKPFVMQSYIDSCVRESLEDSLKLIIPQGGFLDPENSVTFEDHKVAYLCYIGIYYEPCISQHPLLLKEIEEELERKTISDLSECFKDMQEDAGARSAEIVFENGDPPKVDISLQDDLIILGIEKSLTLYKEESSEKFDEYKVVYQSPLYNLASIAAEISHQEGKYCYFETAGYGVYNPRYNIVKYAHIEGGAEIYSIIDTLSEEEMFIAIRSCALPLGLPIDPK